MPPRGPQVMGILNLTPDSFSDGGAYPTPDLALAAAHAMRAAGADIIDIGAESTRPGAVPVSPADEITRLLPVIAPLAAAGLTISVDTRNAATMRACLDAGAALINDVSGLTWDPAATPLLAERGCTVILMHMRGTPADMDRLAVYTDVVADVMGELAARRDAAIRAGISASAILLDPGLGFAKTAAHNFELLRRLPEFAALGCPLVVGASRKRFIGALTDAGPRDRLGGSIAAAILAAQAGAAILRVHDVAETVQALALLATVAGQGAAPPASAPPIPGLQLGERITESSS